MRPLSLKIASLVVGTALFMSAGCDGPSTYVHKDLPPNGVSETAVGSGKNSPSSLVGERFFRETRFSEYFFSHASGKYNELPASGDPIVETLETLEGPKKHPSAGQSVSCASCHFVDQAKATSGFGVRAYCDASRRSRVPSRNGDSPRTVRNSPNMVAMALGDGMFLHNDGEFIRPEDLIRSSYLGRNMGWFPTEELTAIRHLAEVVRNDSGVFPTDTDLAGYSYRDLLSGADSVPERLRVPTPYRVNTWTASDEEIFRSVILLVGQYLRSIDYSRDADGNYNGSPYDAFLKKNGFPMAPAKGESSAQYSNRLIQQVATAASAIRFVNEEDGKFKLHRQEFVFSEKELKGMKTFFGAGKCAQCHPAPDFTDHLFHNTGVSQFEYDQLHGAGAFKALQIPRLADRNSHADVFLPPSAEFPAAQAIFRSTPMASDPQRADLGAWSVLFNPAMPLPQASLRSAVCQVAQLNCGQITEADLLDASVGLFKTPSARDLGQSAPYFHTGHAETIEEIVSFYAIYSEMARKGQVRNPSPELKDVRLTPEDVESLALFLKALNEDYN